MLVWRTRLGVPRRLSVAIVLAAVGAIACGGDGGEASLARASEKLAEARAHVEEARDLLAKRQAAVEKARAREKEARVALNDAEARLAKLEEKVDRQATDAVLFRAVQKRLLEEGDLERVAIAARVERGVVYLSGSVPDPKLRDRAEAVAASVGGVGPIENQIQVTAPKRED